MAKKPSGLGRSLGDLLSDNTPEVRKGSSTVILRAEDGNKIVNRSSNGLYDQQKPKNKSVKANFR